MRLDPGQARARFDTARVARLATAGRDRRPHLVPVTFAVLGERIVFAVDHKPKRSTDLRRLRNIVENPAVCFLVDGYDEDWDRLWWARADGGAEVLDPASAGADPGYDREAPAALDALAAKYPQYRAHRPTGPLVRTTITHWTGWSATP